MFINKGVVMTKLKWLIDRRNSIQSIKDRIYSEANTFKDVNFGYIANFDKSLKELTDAYDFVCEEIVKESATDRKVIIPAPITTRYENRLEVVTNYKELAVELNRPKIKRSSHVFANSVISKMFGDFIVLGSSFDYKRKWVCKCKCGEFELFTVKQFMLNKECYHGSS